MATITGYNITEGNIIDFGTAVGQVGDVTVMVSVATVDYVEIADGLGGPGLWVIPIDFTQSVYVEIDEGADYKIIG